MLDFRPQGVRPFGYTQRSDPMRLLMMAVSSALLLFIILKLGKPPLRRPVPSPDEAVAAPLAPTVRLSRGRAGLTGVLAEGIRRRLCRRGPILEGAIVDSAELLA